MNKQSRKATYPLSSMRGTVLFRLLKAKQDLTRMPYVPETMHKFHYTCHSDCGRGLQEKLRKFHRKCEMDTAINYNRSSGGVGGGGGGGGGGSGGGGSSSSSSSSRNMGKSMTKLVVCK